MSDTNVYQPAYLQVSNAIAGQLIQVELQAVDSPVAWSTGPAFTNSGGINIHTNGGTPLPLSNFSINTSQVQIMTSSYGGGSGSLSFSISLYLVAQAGIQYFSLRSRSDPGVIVQFNTANSKSQTLNGTFTACYWPQ